MYRFQQNFLKESKKKIFQEIGRSDEFLVFNVNILRMTLKRMISQNIQDGKIPQRGVQFWSIPRQEVVFHKCHIQYNRYKVKLQGSWSMSHLHCVIVNCLIFRSLRGLGQQTCPSLVQCSVRYCFDDKSALRSIMCPKRA